MLKFPSTYCKSLCDKDCYGNWCYIGQCHAGCGVINIAMVASVMAGNAMLVVGVTNVAMVTGVMVVNAMLVGGVMNVAMVTGVFKPIPCWLMV